MPSLPILSSNRRPSAAVARFIAAFEGGASRDGAFRPYFDRAGGVWTQGFGHTEGVGQNDTPWSRRKAESVLRADLNGPKYGGAVRKFLKANGIRVSQKQFDALTSLVYNAGPGVLGRNWRVGRALQFSALRARHRPSWRAHVGQEWLSTAVTGAAVGRKKLPGLVRRRRAESALWMGGRYNAS